MICKYFLLVWNLSLFSFAEQRFYIVIKPTLSIFSFVDYAFGVVSKNSAWPKVREIFLLCFLEVL